MLLLQAVFIMFPLRLEAGVIKNILSLSGKLHTAKIFNSSGKPERVSDSRQFEYHDPEC